MARKYAMSSTQKRLYVIDQIQKSNITYNIPIIMKVEGEVDLKKLQDALNKLCSRHEVLRTYFKHTKNKFLQIIEDNVEIKLEYVEDVVDDIKTLQKEFIRPFDLSVAPLMRAKLIKNLRNEIVLMLDIHHIICDGESTGILIEELSRLYNEETLPELTIQYKDYSSWQNSRDMSAYEEHWLNEFSGEIPVLDLKTDYQRPQHQSFKGNSITTLLSKKYKNAIKNMSMDTGATEYMILLSTFMLLLSKYTRQNEIIVGSPIAGRTHSQTQNMLGMFVNTLAIKGNFNANKKFTELIDEIKEKCFKAYDYQDYPFESLVEKIGIERDPSRNPLFDVMFALQNNGKVELTLGNSNLVPINFEGNVAKFDLTVSVEETLEGYELNWEYCTDLFKKDTIERMSEHFKELLSSALQNPQKKLCEIDLLSNLEKEKVLKEFNKTHIIYPTHKSIIEIFEEQVAKNPKSVAVEFENETLTYEQLNEKANYVGEQLRKMGVKPDNIVGLITKRSMEMIIGIYGILKSGGAYVPIDVNHPIDRIKYMLKDCETQVLLAGPGTEGIVAELQDYKIIDLKKCEGKTTNNLVHVTMPSNLAYIIFTSGTTGNPKGVMVENRNLLNLINWQVLNGDINENSVILQKSTYIFDASVWEIFLAGLSGAKLQLLSENSHSDPAELFQIFTDKQITHALIVPSMFRMLLEYAENHNKTKYFNTFKRIFLGAEALTGDLVEKYINLTGNNIDTLTNLYGPTEGTVCVTSYNFSDDTTLCTIPIGKPISNTQVYILNGNSLCGIGMPGELCVSGDSISRGYLNRPDLTAEKFVENPYNKYEKIYRTGDLVRWIEDGNIEYLGRIDEQVKIKGFRIELGEIENKLRALSSIQDAIVIAKGDSSNKYLCGYIVSDKKADINIIKSQLAESLPEYMIPLYIVQLEKFPVTRSGKLDKKSLPEPKVIITKEYVAPRDNTETCIAEVFTEILGAKQVGIDDNFFELGGDSIKAIRIVSKLRDYDYQISVRDIMQGKTIRNISLGVIKLKAITAEYTEVSGIVNLTPIQKEFFSSNLIAPEHFNQCFMLENNDKINLECLKKSLEALVKHHDMLRAIYKDGIQYILPISESKLYDLNCYDFSHIRNKETLYTSIEEMANNIQSSINLSTGPLFKVAIFSTEKVDYLMLCIHHLVVDGVSWRIIIEDLNKSYTNAIDNMEIKLSAKTISFQAWSEKLMEYRESYSLKKEIPYWLQIEKKVQASKLNSELSKSENEIENIEMGLSQNLTSKLLYSANNAYSTEINDLLLTALFRSINKITGNETVSVNMEGHGREPIGDKPIIDRTIGWFTSVYPIAVDKIGKSLREDICNTKETLRRIPNRGIGYGILKTLGDHVIEGVQSDITFNYLGEFGQEHYNNGFTLSDVPRGLDVSKRNNFGTPISINGAITDKQLNMTLSYDRAKYSKEFMKELEKQFLKQLTEVIEYCVSAANNEYTASDFGELTWNHEEFTRVYGKLKNSGYEIERIYPMTAMQEGMLYHKIENNKSTSYVVQSIYKVKKNINEQALIESLELLTVKHEILRTSMVYNNVSEPRQVLLKNRAIELNSLDFMGDLESINKYEEIKKEDIKRGFDLEKDSLLRMTLIKLKDDEIHMMISFHHIIMDGWCLSILINDLVNFYDELCSGKDKNILKQSIIKKASYEEYIRLVASRDQETDLNYWKELLEGYDEYSGIRPEGKVQASDEEVNRVETSLTKKETKVLEEISSKYGVTMNTVVEAAWGILLQKYNNTNDVVFGKVVSGRNAKVMGIEEMIGLFINTIPVRVEIKENETFVELICRLQKQAFTSEEYDYCPLVEIQNQSSLGSKLIQTMMAFENYYDQESKKEDSLGLEMQTAREQTNYPLTLSAYKSDALFLGLMYETNKYKEQEASRILKRLSNVLRNLIENPEIKIDSIEVVELLEQDKLLKEFNATSVDYFSDKTIIELFEEQVEKTPKKIAVAFNSEEITYAKLNEKSNQLARKLRKLGVTVDEFIGIMAERSIEMIIGILAILKAGGAYLPIDPKYPLSRIKYILKDSNSKIVLTGNTDLSQITDLSVEVISLLNESIFDGMDKNLTKINSSKDLAYLIYTSGTTGEPKGVMIEHRSVNRLVKNSTYLNFNNIRILQTGSLTFDASTFEIWGSLLNGGSLYLVENDVVTNTKLLREAISNYKINTLWLTVSLYNQMISTEKEIFDELTYLLIGGEQLSEPHVKLLRDRNKKIRLINGYGPTESTTFAVMYEFQEDVRTPIPIGKPISNTQVYILNNNSLCGIGMAGELCIGGPGLSRGYLNQPKLTSDKFVENPYELNEKIYRSGDLARWTEDGNIEYLGRIDEQVKIRGFRIELGEIENKLKALCGIENSVVIVKEDNGEKYLCAYIVSNIALNLDIIKEELRIELPEYMVPSYIMQLENFPITTNGKLDKKSLPEPKISSNKEYIAPRNEEEICISEAFQQILKVNHIGIDDGFFELGGHSLKATRLVNIIEEKLNVRIPLRDIFAEKTVRKLAEKIKNITNAGEYKRIEAQPKKNSYPMSSAQRRLYLIHQIQEENITYNVPNMIKVQGKLELERLQHAINKLIARHEILRTSFVMEDGTPVQKITQDITLPLEYCTGNIENIDSIFKEFVRPFELSVAPLMRIKVVEIGAYETILMFDIHHIIFDGGSVSVLFDDLSKLYSNENLFNSRVQYKDYSVWQNGRTLNDQEEYWLKEFSGDIPVLDLQTDFPRPQKQSYKGNSITTVLSQKQKDAVKALSLETDATEYMILMSVFMMLLSRYSRKEEIIVGSPVSGRVHPDTQNMIGMFVNTLAIKGNMDSNEKFVAIVEQMKEKCLKSFENQEYPFEELVEKVDIERDLSRNPLFDVVFVLQNNEDTELVLPELKTTTINFENTVAKFDLTVSMRELEEGYELNWEYCTGLFREETIEKMAKNYSELLTNALKNPEKKLWEISMLSNEEQLKVINDFNMTLTDYPHDKTIIELFEEQVKGTPENIAVVLNNEKITYSQLNKKSNQLAIKLRNLGVTTNSFVGIIAERRIEMIIGILGILKAGGAYMPIDPKYPIDRIQYMLKDSATKVIITGDTDLSNIDEELATVINLFNSDIYTGSVENLDIINHAEDLAYLIYTSGTTGEPKGVMIEQRSVNRLVRNTNYVDFKDVRILQTGSLTFDASTFEIWGSLLNGGTLYLIDYDVLTNALLFKNVLVDYKINTMFITTALYNQLISIDNTFFDSVQQLLFGGEATSEKHVRSLVEHNNNIHFSNVYGPTESTTFTTFYPIHADKLLAKTPIGKPISNTTLYVLNALSLCGIGVPGELCIGGVGLSRGYLNRPELTAEKFIDNPYCTGEKIYRTGDLVRWLDDGNIEYLGRIDHQVKLRGFRIELGEIESKLRENPIIQDAAVIINEYNDEKYICAYVATKDIVESNDIRDYLTITLPDYMIPKYIMILDSLPMTRNGKLDKKILPMPEFTESKNYIAPRDEVELCLVNIFESVLGVKKVGIDDSFFELGGDSIKAIRTISKLRECGYEIGIRNIMRDRTIRAIRTGISKVAISTVEQSEILGKVDLTPIQIDVFTNKLEVPNHFNQSFILESKERINQENLKKALTAIVEHHDMLRAVYHDDVITIRPISEGNLYSFKYYDFSNIKEDELLYRKIDESANELQSSINLSTGPLMKVGVFCTEYKDYLFIAIHHLVVDGVSWRIILEDLSRGYLTSKENKEIILPAKTVSFKKWSELLKEYRESNALKQEIIYWKETELKVKESKVISTVNESEYGIDDVIVHLNIEQTNDLLYKAGRAYSTEINDLLLTALFRTVNKITGNTSVSVNMEGHGREPIDVSMAIDRTVGWFTSVYPVATNRIGENIRKDIYEVKETLRKIPNHGIGYGVLKVLGDKVLEGIEPDITFNYLGEFGQENHAENFLLSDIPHGQEISVKNKFGTAISVNGAIINKELNLIINYDKKRFDKCFMENFKIQYENQLLDIISHCVKVRKTENADANSLKISSSENNFDIPEFIWSKFNVDSIVKIINVTSQEYAILFVENIDEKMRNEIINTMIEKLSLKYIPHYCINMDKYQFSQNIMDEKTFREMCSDTNSLSTNHTSQIELKKFNSNLSNKIIEQYAASCMQKSFLEAYGTIIEEIITIDGVYNQDKIIEAIKIIVQEQSILRSSYEKCDKDYIICEHEYNTSWYIPYIDLRYASYEYIASIYNDIHEMKNGAGNYNNRNNLIRIVIIKESEVSHKVHIIANHSGWDKASTQILSDRVNDLIKTNSTKTLITATYKNYVEEIKYYTNIANNIELSQLKIKDFIKNAEGYIQDNVDNNLEKSILLTVKMGPKSLKIFKETPWNLLTHIFKIIVKENQLTSQDKTSIPLFVLQEDRRDKNMNYINTMGEFLDILPISVDCSQEIFNYDMQKYVEEVQNIKKDKNINYLELLSREQEDFYSLSPSILSINYHGLFELNYEIVQRLLSLDNLRASSEIFVNCYSNYLVLSLPIYKKCTNDLGKILQKELDLLETKFNTMSYHF